MAQRLKKKTKGTPSMGRGGQLVRPQDKGNRFIGQNSASREAEKGDAVDDVRGRGLRIGEQRGHGCSFVDHARVLRKKYAQFVEAERVRSNPRILTNCPVCGSEVRQAAGGKGGGGKEERSSHELEDRD